MFSVMIIKIYKQNKTNNVILVYQGPTHIKNKQVQNFPKELETTASLLNTYELQINIKFILDV